jgi:dienelactone hydrolase
MAGILLTIGCRESTLNTFSGHEGTPVVSPTEAPAGAETLAVEWVKISTPGSGATIAAIARPGGTGPFPAVLILHGTHGFALEYVQLAQAMARRGVVGVAACWFAGGRGAGSRFITPIACPDAPPLSAASSDTAQWTVAALVRAVRELPGVRADRVALFGHSRGGGAALNYTLHSHLVRAVILNSAGYPGEMVERARDIRTPILILHGTADDPADGGSALSNVQMARNFESALRRAGKSVEAKYYEGGRHNGLFASATQRDDEVERAMIFLQRYLLE